MKSQTLINQVSLKTMNYLPYCNFVLTTGAKKENTVQPRFANDVLTFLRQKQIKLIFNQISNCGTKRVSTDSSFVLKVNDKQHPFQLNFFSAVGTSLFSLNPSYN